MLDRWGHVVARHAVVVVLLGIVALVGAGAYGSKVFDSLSQGGFDDASSESAQELAAERDLFGNQSVDVVAIYSDPDARADSRAFERDVRATLAGIPEGTTTRVVSYYDTGDESLLSKDGHSTQVLISLAGDGQNALLDSWDELKPSLEAADDTGLSTDLAGSFAVYGDVNHFSETDLRKAETLSMPVVLILSLLIFGSLVAASMPVLVGMFAVVGAMAVIRLLSTFTAVSVFSVNVITLIGLGLAIDYALFVISRFREELAKLPADDPAAVPAALRVTMRTAGRTVLFSGLTVAAALSSLLVVPQTFLKSMGYGGMAAVVVAMVSALTVLPAALRLLGRRIDKGRVPFLHRRRRPGRHGGEVASEDGAWARLAHSVMRRPARRPAAGGSPTTSRVRSRC